MSRMKKNGKKICFVVGAIGVIAVLAVVLFLVLRKEEESYRIIRVSEVTGEVFVNRKGMEGLEAYPNMNLLSGDEIVTEKGAQVTLRLDEDKYIVLDEESKMTLHATGSAQDSKTKLQLEYGAVFSDIKNKLSKDSGYEVITPASTMSVRGTKFEVVYREKQSKVLTYEGAVYVEVAGSKEGKLINAGEWNTVIETAEGDYHFDGESKKIEAEDVGGFILEYIEASGIVFEENDESAEEPTKVPTAAPTPTPEPTKAPTTAPTPTPEPTKAPTAAPTPTPEPTKAPTTAPTPTPEPTKAPTKAPTTAPTPTPEPTKAPTPTPKLETGECEIRYYIPNPPLVLLPKENSYTVSYSDSRIVITAGEYTDSYAANVAPYATDACSLDTDVSPLIISATENYLSTALAGRLAEYGTEAAVKCFGWYDTAKTMWFDWGIFIRDTMLENGGLNLYPAYTLRVPAQLPGAKPDEISCVPVLITVEETGEIFCLNLPAGARLKCVSQNGNVLKWKQNGTETDEISVGHSTISLFSLSVTK